MSGQLAPFGASALANHAGGASAPFVSNTAPTSWVPGQAWVNTSFNPAQLYSYRGDVPYNSAEWFGPGSVSLYIALLTGNPFAVSTQGGNIAVYPADITPIELATSGYARQLVTFSAAGTVTGSTPGSDAYDPTYPAPVSNAAPLQFQVTANMTQPVQWAALIVSTVASGTLGWLKYLWTLNPPQQVQAFQTITIPAGDLVLDQS